MLLKDVLKAAKRLIKIGGWCQSTSMLKTEDGKCKYCTAYAIHTAAKKLTETPEACKVATAKAQALFSKANNLHGIVSWNDTIGRTKREVLLAFDNALREFETNER